jgi:predicted lipid-binding transport protein (Tim44 family)
MKFWTVLLALVLAFGAMDADAARRLGGGGSIGRQSGNVTQRYSQPPASPTAPSVQPQRSPGVQPAPVPQPVRRPWGGMLGGLAAGLGLAWLAHTLGFGEAFGHFMLFALLALVIMVVLATLRARRNPPGGYAYQGAGGSADAPLPLPQYNPEKVGNDASARPWEQGATPIEPVHGTGGGVRIGSALEAPRDALAGPQNWGVPAGFDADGFITAAKRNFVTLQSAWDRGELASLRSMMTDEMLEEVRKQLAEREHQPQPVGRTEVLMLEAKLLGIEELATEYMASVEFSGMLREESDAGPAPFREVWNMVKPKDGSAGWLVAGVQALQ